MSKKILVINGHSIKDSFCEAIANEYVASAKKNNDVNLVNLYNLKFDPALKVGYRSDKKQVLEADIKKVQSQISDADHLVFVYPVWWGDAPALLKGFLDRVLIPGFAFDPKNKKMGLPTGLLKGKSAQLIITMGSPHFVYRTFLGSRATKIMKSSLGYCGIKPVKSIHFCSIDSSKDSDRKEMLKKVRVLASKK